jgi:hypothetical protein
VIRSVKPIIPGTVRRSQVLPVLRGALDKDLNSAPRASLPVRSNSAPDGATAKRSADTDSRQPACRKGAPMVLCQPTLISASASPELDISRLE